MTVRHPLDRPELAPLWGELQTRLSSGRAVSRITLGPLSDATREALADLLGLDRLPATRTTLTLARLDEALRDSVGQDARTVTEAVLGPLDNRASARERAEAERAALWEWLETHPVLTGRPALAPWAVHLRRTGLLQGSVPATRHFLDQVLKVLAALPAQNKPLPVFAHSLFGDSHALDDGTRLSGTVLRALGTLYDTGPPASAADRRSLWALAGVADDALSSTVLTAGLRPGGTGAVARALTTLTAAGHASHLTLAQLRTPGEFLPGPDPVHPVHITENPSILALAVQRLGPRCPPLVCTAGWPNSAAVLLLHLLASTGAALRYHGDFDGEGLRIAAYVRTTTGAALWRMSTADYLAALASSATRRDPGRITDAPWDADLAPALMKHRTAVLEEQVADLLLEDLSLLLPPGAD
jgi:uncharacterized protein (TIGR02679 family)